MSVPIEYTQTRAHDINNGSMNLYEQNHMEKTGVMKLVK